MGFEHIADGAVALNSRLQWQRRRGGRSSSDSRYPILPYSVTLQVSDLQQPEREKEIV